MQTRFSGWRIAAFAIVVLGLTGPGQTIGVSVFIDHFADDLELSKNAIAGGYAIGAVSGGSLNPAVSFGISSANIINEGKFYNCLIYSAYEFIGAGAAAGIFHVTHPQEYK